MVGTGNDRTFYVIVYFPEKNKLNEQQPHSDRFYRAPDSFAQSYFGRYTDAGKTKIYQKDK